MPCRGQWCTTTCELWDLFVLGPDDKRRPVSCDMYKSGMAYPRGAQLCDESCLIPEIRSTRYPAPTGYGIMCRPHTCAPAATPLPHVGPALGELQCPCNWFGSECTNDWIPIQEIRKEQQRQYGPHLQFVTLKLDPNGWNTVIQDYRPGGVIRITQLDDKGIPQEMACALAGFDTPGELQLWMARPPDEDASSSLRPEPRLVADRLWNLKASGPVSNLYVNPTISGFFNGKYQYLMEYLKEHEEISHVVLLATGAGLGGALSAVEAIVAANNNKKNISCKPIQIYVYYGLRNLDHLPCRNRLEQLASTGAIQLTLVVSGDPENNIDGQMKNLSVELQTAVERGIASGKLKPVKKMADFMSSSSRPYTQHVVGLDFSSKNGRLRGAPLENTIFIDCGRVELLYDTSAILKALSGDSERISEHVFTNI